MMVSDVTLIIKAANQSVPDQHMVCDSGWSVSLLKNHLSSVHPAKPRVDEQRLIYSGQLLADNLLLRNVLRHPTENNAYTIHLVCSPPRHTPQQAPANQRLASPPPTISASQRLASQPTPTPPANQRHSSEPPPSSTSQSASVPRPSTNQGGASMGEAQDGSTTTTHPEVPVSSELTDGLRRRNVNNSSDSTPQSIEAASAYPSQQLPLSALQGASADPIQQMATMQQMYANYMAYIQYMQMGGVVGGLAWPQQMVQLPSTATLPATAAAAATSATPPDPADALQPPADQNQPADPQPAQAPQQIRMNAQGGEVEDEEEDEGLGRDWLDWIYVLSRMVVLLSIVYFYSTLSRFMFVIGIAMLLYLYQAGWFRPTRRIEHPPPQANVQPNPDDRNNNDDNDNNNGDEDEDEDTDETDPAEPEPPQEALPSDRGVVIEEVVIRPSLLALTWTFLTTFFSSLIPEQPQGI